LQNGFYNQYHLETCAVSGYITGDIR